jgi:O-antigen ligase
MLHTVLLSFSRGGMLGLIVTGAVSFALIPKTLKHYVVLALVVAVGLQLAGKEVRERFMMSFEDSSQRDAAAEERLQLWKACVDVMKTKPMVGCGPAHWPLVAESYGFPPGKAAHSTWMQTGAELGLPALAALMSFFVILVWRLWPFARNKAGNYEPWFQDSARMVIASMAGFGVSAQFVTVSLLEPAYYVALVGACLLKLASNQTVQHPYVPVHADKYRSMHPDPMALIPR